MKSLRQEIKELAEYIGVSERWLIGWIRAISNHMRSKNHEKSLEILRGEISRQRRIEEEYVWGD